MGQMKLLFVPNNKIVSTVLLVAVLTFVASGTAVAQKSPKGKPFIQLEGQIIQVQGDVTTELNNLQDQIDALVGEVDSLEGRVAANEGAISDLQAQDLVLQGYIDNNTASIAFLNDEIARLTAEDVILQGQITSLGDTDGLLQDQIDANESLIGVLQQAVLAMDQELRLQIDALDAANVALLGEITALGDALSAADEALRADLETQIDANANQIAALRSESRSWDSFLWGWIQFNDARIDYLLAEVNDINDHLALMQTIISGNCPTGFAIRQVNADGSVDCAAVGTAVSGLENIVKWGGTFVIPFLGVAQDTVSCPSDTVVTGGGFAAFRAFPDESFQQGNGWHVKLRSNLGAAQNVGVHATCVKLK